MKVLASLLFILVLLSSCATPDRQATQPLAVDVKLRLKGVDAVRVEQDGDGIGRMMDVRNVALELSEVTHLLGDTAYMRLWSGLGTVDHMRMWHDFRYIRANHPEITKVGIYMNSGGGQAFAGLCFVDLIYEMNGYFEVTAYANGIVASAAVPIFAACENRVATKGTHFMVHQASSFKYGFENASDVRAQNELHGMLRKRYVSVMAENSNLSAQEWIDLEMKTSWFTAEQAQAWGMVDEIR